MHIPSNWRFFIALGGLSAFWGCVGCVVGIGVSHTRAPCPQFGVVDMAAIVGERARLIAAEGKEVTPARLRAVAQEIREELAEWASAHQMIILSKGVVWGGSVTDVTSEPTASQMYSSHEPLPATLPSKNHTGA